MLIWIKIRGRGRFKGIIFILAFFWRLRSRTGYDSVASGKTSYIAVTAIIVIFHPELRKALERSRPERADDAVSTDDTKKNEDFSERRFAELVRACFEMGKSRRAL